MLMKTRFLRDVAPCQLINNCWMFISFFMRFRCLSVSWVTCIRFTPLHHVYVYYHLKARLFVLKSEKIFLGLFKFIWSSPYPDLNVIASLDTLIETQRRICDGLLTGMWLSLLGALGLAFSKPTFVLVNQLSEEWAHFIIVLVNNWLWFCLTKASWGIAVLCCIYSICASNAYARLLKVSFFFFFLRTYWSFFFPPPHPPPPSISYLWCLSCTYWLIFINKSNTSAIFIANWGGEWFMWNQT